MPTQDITQKTFWQVLCMGWPVLALSLAFGLVWAGCARPTASPPDASVYLKAADAFMAQGDFGSAYRSLNKALDLRPEDPQVHLNLAWLHLYTDDPERARRELAKVPGTPPEALHLQGALQAYFRKDREAVATYRQALKTAEKNNPRLHFDLGESLARLKDYPAAVKAFEAGLKRVPPGESKTPYLLGLCSAHYRLNQLKPAMARYDEAAASTQEPQEKQAVLDFVENLKLLQEG